MELITKHFLGATLWLTTIFGIKFSVMKLLGFLTMSWWWVAPLSISFALISLMIVGAFMLRSLAKHGLTK